MIFAADVGKRTIVPVGQKRHPQYRNQKQIPTLMQVAQFLRAELELCGAVLDA